MNLERAVRRYVPMSETMFYILLSLREPSHGYGVMLHVKEITAGRLVLGAGTLYQSIGRLEGDGLIKIYQITELGAGVLDVEGQRIRELYRNLEGLK
mgnify:CR=1 FL=1